MAENAQRSRWIHELTWDVIKDHLDRDDVVLVPIGATEQHGRHAPLLLDTGWAIAASEAAAALAGCLIAPPLHYGWSYGHMAFPGTVGLTAETLTRVALEIGEALVRHGFRRVIYVNGNRMANLAPMEIAAVRLRLETGAFVAVADCGLIARADIAALSDGPPGTLGHAGESETALVLARYPHLTDMALSPPDRVPGSVHSGLREGHHTLDSRLEGNAWFVARDPEEFRRQTEARDGVVGDARLATAEKGEAMVQAIGRRIAEGIEEARRRQVDVRVPPVRG